MAKKIGGKNFFWRQMTIFGGSGGNAAVFFKLREICPKSKLLPFLTIGLGCKLSSGITE